MKLIEILEQSETELIGDTREIAKILPDEDTSLVYEKRIYPKTDSTEWVVVEGKRLGNICFSLMTVFSNKEAELKCIEDAVKQNGWQETNDPNVGRILEESGKRVYVADNIRLLGFGDQGGYYMATFVYKHNTALTNIKHVDALEGMRSKLLSYLKLQEAQAEPKPAATIQAEQPPTQYGQAATAQASAQQDKALLPRKDFRIGEEYYIQVGRLWGHLSTKELSDSVRVRLIVKGIEKNLGVAQAYAVGFQNREHRVAPMDDGNISVSFIADKGLGVDQLYQKVSALLSDASRVFSKEIKGS